MVSYLVLIPLLNLLAMLDLRTPITRPLPTLADLSGPLKQVSLPLATLLQAHLSSIAPRLVALELVANLVNDLAVLPLFTFL